MSQKIVIPKGLIDPDQTTIIEIPEGVQHLETVVAKPRFMKSGLKEDEVLRSFDHLPNEHNIKYIQEEIEEYYDDSYDNELLDRTSQTMYQHQIPSYKSWNVFDCEYYVEDVEPRTICQQTNCKSPCKTFNTPKNVAPFLDILDRIELDRLFKNLRNYQEARRKLLYEMNLNTVEDITSTLEAFNYQDTM